MSITSTSATGTGPDRAPRPMPHGTGRPLVVAHRGYSAAAPENTLAAFEAALRCGADYLETDLHPTTDGGVALVHDVALHHTTSGSGRVTESDLAGLDGLDAGSWFAPAFAGQRVPVLADLLGLLGRYPDAGLLLEFKDRWQQPQVARAVAEIEASGHADRVIVQGFDVRTVAALRDGAPGLRRALLVGRLPDDLTADARARRRDLGIGAYNPHVAALVDDPGVVARLHAAGLQVWTWTVDEPELWDVLLEAGVDAVITNRPDRLRGWLDARVGPGGRPERPERPDLVALALRQGGRAPAASR